MQKNVNLQLAENSALPNVATNMAINGFSLIDLRNYGLSEREIEVRDILEQEIGEHGYTFIAGNVDLNEEVFVTSTSTPLAQDRLKKFCYDHVINLKKINNTPAINTFLVSVNARLPIGGLFVGCVETFATRKERLFKKIPKPFIWLYYPVDVLITRGFPKLRPTKGLYFFLTRGRVRVLSRAETLGRLYFCGFEVVEEKQINDKLFFVARKVNEVGLHKSIHYGPVIKLKRVGKGGRPFNVYKLRTMHAYSEYLQQYVFEKNKLQEGGKFKNDFRISPEGKFLRKFWLDELPMLVNLLKGDMKLIGVRPLSSQYFSLYTKELQEKRTRVKPGLVPPFYADLPKTLEEIMSSEMRYLDAYEKSPLKTDMVYMFKIIKNIFFKGARSK